VGDATFAQVKDQLKDYVLNEKRQAFIDSYINNMGNRTAIKVGESWVEKQYTLSIDNPVDSARTSGKPSMVDFGSEGCGPCDMMTPILAELKKDYADRVNILFVPVREEQILAARFGIKSIPVQVFFDKDGKEVFRHVGFFAKDQILSKLAELGVK
ncbi:MAG: thioredoxin family protein, partial [Armatimonadota bacterium]